MKPVMYLFVNRALRMTEGKSYAQAGHAAVEAFRLSKQELIEPWDKSGKTKVALLAEDETNLQMIDQYIRERGFATYLVIDEGRTEIRPFSATALGVEIVDRDDPDVLATFSHFRTYKTLPPPEAVPTKSRDTLSRVGLSYRAAVLLVRLMAKKGGGRGHCG